MKVMCRENKIKLFSKLNKQQLIELLEKNNIDIYNYENWKLLHTNNI